MIYSSIERGVLLFKKVFVYNKKTFKKKKKKKKKKQVSNKQISRRLMGILERGKKCKKVPFLP